MGLARSSILFSAVVPVSAATQPFAYLVKYMVGGIASARVQFWSHYWAFQVGMVIANRFKAQTYVTRLQTTPFTDSATSHPPLTFDDFISHLPKSCRADSRRNLRKCEKAGINQCVALQSEAHGPRIEMKSKCSTTTGTLANLGISFRAILGLVWGHESRLVRSRKERLTCAEYIECSLLTATMLVRWLSWQRGTIHVFRDSKGSLVAVAACASIGSTLVTGPYFSSADDSGVYYLAMKDVIEQALEMHATDINWQLSAPGSGPANNKKRYALAELTRVDLNLALRLPT